MILQRLRDALGGSGARQALANMGWLAMDRVMRAVLGLLVGAWVARYLGPSAYGELAYVLAFIALFQVVSKLGLDSLVVRAVARDPAEAGEVLGTACALQLAAGLCAFFASVGIIGLLRPGDSAALCLTLILAPMLVLQPAEVVDLWFQSQTRSRLTVLAKFGAALCASGLRIWLILSEAPLPAFAYASLAEVALAAASLAIAYQQLPAPDRWRWRADRGRVLLAEAWPYAVAGIAIILYMRIDQLMLRTLTGTAELGIYSAALPLSTAWHFVPLIVCATLAPAIARDKVESEERFTHRVRTLFSLMWWIGLPLCVAIALVANPLIGALYGPAFAAAAPVLMIHVFGNIPVALGIAQQQWLVNNQRGQQVLARTVLGAVVNVLLNLWLIPRYGARGAALASLVSLLVADVLYNVFFIPELARLQFAALVNPVLPATLPERRGGP